MDDLQKLMEERAKEAERLAAEKESNENAEQLEAERLAAEQAAQEAAKPNDNAIQFDHSKFGVSTPEELEMRWSQLNKLHEEWEQNKAASLSREQELIEKLKQKEEMLEKTTSYEDEDMARLAYLKSQKDDRFKIFNKIVNDDVDHIDILKIDMKKSLPNKSAEEINKLINAKYGLNIKEPNRDKFDDEDDYMDAVEQYNEKILIGKTNLELDSQKAFQRMQEEFKAIKVPVKESKPVEQIMIEKNAAKETWGPYIPEIGKLISKESFSVKSGDETITIDFEANPEKVKEYERVINDYVFSNALSYNAENSDMVKTVTKNWVRMDYINQLAQSIFDKGIEYANKKLEAKYGNPRGAGDINKNNASGKMSLYEESLEKAKSLNK